MRPARLAPLCGDARGGGGRRPRAAARPGSCSRGASARPRGSSLALRLMGGVHRLVLMGRLPELAALYPSAGGEADARARRHAVHRGARRANAKSSARSSTAPSRRTRCGGPRRCSAASAWSPPRPAAARVLEVGASAGLNLRFDRYRTRPAALRWGDPDSPVRFEDVFESATPPLDARARRSPSAAGATRARSTRARARTGSRSCHTCGPTRAAGSNCSRRRSRWPRATPVEVERAGAAEWAERALARAPPGRRDGALPLDRRAVPRRPEEGEALHAAIVAAGSRATSDAPFAWLFLEPGGEQDGRAPHALAPGRFSPGEEARLLARAGYHSSPVEWLAAPGPQ